MVLYLLVFFAMLVTVEAVFAAWWDLPDESFLALFAAGAVVVLPVLLLRAARRSPEPRFEAGIRWATEHVIASSAVLAIALFSFVFVWGVVVREPWGENLAWSAGGAAALLAAMVVFGYTERAIRRREARKRGIAPEDYKPGKVARRLGWTLAGIAAVYLALGLAIELSDALG
jgi:hypothetical protein